MKIILASGSPRRRELLGLIYKDFSVITSDVDESYSNNTPTAQIPEILARRKTMAVAEKHSDALTVGADTIVALNGEVFGKPHNEQDAKRMLRALSGKTHSVITGCCISQNGRIHSFSQETLVSFYDLSDDEICKYIATGEPFDKAGAYGIQGYGSLLVRKIDGDYFNVVGLPVARLKRETDKFLIE